MRLQLRWAFPDTVILVQEFKRQALFNLSIFYANAKAEHYVLLLYYCATQPLPSMVIRWFSFFFDPICVNRPCAG